MKKWIGLTFCCAILSLPLFANDHRDIKMKGMKPAISIDDEIVIRKQGRSIVIECEEEPSDFVEITRHYELFINNSQVETDEHQDVLIREYYDVGMEVFEEVKEIGWEGARIGLSGVGIGVKAIVGVARMLLPDYSSEDFENDMEQAGEDIELRAEALEERGEWIDEQLDTLESVHNQLLEAMPELQNLDWF